MALRIAVHVISLTHSLKLFFVYCMEKHTLFCPYVAHLECKVELAQSRNCGKWTALLASSNNTRTESQCDNDNNVGLLEMRTDARPECAGRAAPSGRW